MKILYIYRHPAMGYSIQRVFKPIERALAEQHDVHSMSLPCSNYHPASLIKNIWFATKKVNGGGYDIVHITGTEHYLLPFLRKQRTVMTVHDIGSIATKGGLRGCLKRMIWLGSLNYATQLTFVSRKSEQETSERIKLKPPSNVIHNAVDPSYVYTPQPFNADCPRILHIGTKPNKNLSNVILALQGLRCTLRIIGKLSSDEESMLKRASISYTTVSNISDEQVLCEYRQADIVSFPSLYEGFGMPILEGQATGRVVLTSNLSPMKEVAGQGAILVDPASPESIREGFVQAIRHHQVCINAGLENVGHFAVENIARQYAQLYSKMLRQGC